MQRKRNHRNIVLAATTAASLAFGGHVSAQVIRITNANNHEIPLKSGSSVQIDTAGNLLAECALNSSSQCTALSTGGVTLPGVPTASLTRTDTDNDVRVGDTIGLSWTSASADACKATSLPTNGAFTGVRDTASSTSISPTTVGTHLYSLVCYNASGASTVASVSVVVGEAVGGGGGPVGDDDCNLTSSTPGIQPSGWARTDTTWVQLFTPRDGSPVPAYPSSNGFPVPIGATRGSYTAASFTANANQTVNMFWDGAQANPNEGYFTARPANGMFISISPCAGDLRPANMDAGGFLAAGCRKFANTGTLVFSTSPSLGSSNSNACKLEAGKQYYINVLPADPNDGLTPGEHSCSETQSSALGCDVQSRSTTN